MAMGRVLLEPAKPKPEPVKPEPEPVKPIPEPACHLNGYTQTRTRRVHVFPKPDPYFFLFSQLAL